MAVRMFSLIHRLDGKLKVQSPKTVKYSKKGNVYADMGPVRNEVL